MFGYVAAAGVGYGLRALTTPAPTDGQIGEWSWAWAPLPGETRDRKPLGTVRITKEGATLEPPIRLLQQNAEGFAIGVLAGAGEL